MQAGKRTPQNTRDLREPFTFAEIRSHDYAPWFAATGAGVAGADGAAVGAGALLLWLA